MKREGQQCPDETVNDVSQSNEQQRREMEKQKQLREAYQRKKKACEDQMDEDYERIFIRREGLPELIHRPTNTQRRMAKQQVRTGRWRTNQKHQQAGRSIKKAAKMMMSIKGAMKPDNDKITQKVLDNCIMTRAQAKKNLKRNAQATSDQIQMEKKVMEEMTTDWTRNGFGSFQMKKPEFVFRILWENFNSLCILTDRKLSKIRALDELRKRYSADMIAGCETQTNWYQVPDGHHFSDLIGMGEDRKCIAAHNVHNKTRCQPGGTVIATYGMWTTYATTGKDETGLARWTWIVFDCETTVRRFVSGYRPKKPSSLKRIGIDIKEGVKVWEQHTRFYRERDYHNVDPHFNFDNDLLALLRLWRKNGEDVMLMIDVNDHAYTSRFARALADEEIQMKCLFFNKYRQRVPHSHKEGSIPLMTAYASPGLDCQDMFVFKHEYGLGDHRLYGIDLTMQSVFGCSAPTPPRRAGRLLQAKIERIRDPYINDLEKRTERHRLDEKADNLHEVQTFIEQHNLNEEYQDILQTAVDLLDVEHVEHEIGSEKNCRKIKKLP